MKWIDVSWAALRFAQHLAKELVRFGGEHMQQRQMFCELWIKSDHSDALATLGNLDECLGWMTPEQVSESGQSELRVLVELETD